MLEQEPELIEESEWSKIYRISSDTYRSESKFASGDVEVSAIEIKTRWSSLTEERRIDFAQAFVCKPRLTVEDQEILGFLMDYGSEIVWGTIAFRLTEFTERDKAVRFLLEKASEQPFHCANYFRALGSMADIRAVPVLRVRYTEYDRKLNPFDRRTLHELGDYISCCRALFELKGGNEFRDALEKLSVHPDPMVRSRVKMELSEM